MDVRNLRNKSERKHKFILFTGIYIPYNGREESILHYEVLVSQQKGKWKLGVQTGQKMFFWF